MVGGRRNFWSCTAAIRATWSAITRRSATEATARRRCSPARVPVPGDFWGNGRLWAQPRAHPLRKIHRLLRGRYPLALFLGLLGAILGGAAGFFLPPVTYKSDGYIEIKPYMPSILEIDRVM